MGNNIEKVKEIVKVSSPVEYDENDPAVKEINMLDCV